VETENDLETPDIVALRQHLAKMLLLATNMQLESLLSDLKHAAPNGKRAPHAEKVAYQAHLSQIFKSHIADGRLDRRGGLARDELLRMGLPLDQTSCSPSRAQRPDCRWRVTELNTWMREHPEANLEQRCAAARRIAETWAAFSPEEKQNHAAQMAPAPDEIFSEPETASSQGEAPCIWDAGNHEWPLRPEVLRGFVHDHTAHWSRGLPGVASKASQIRKEASAALLVQDCEDIPDAKQYLHRFSCGDLHPGLCASKDADVYRDSLRLAKSLEACLGPTLLCSFLQLSDPSQPAVAPLYFYFCLLRKRRFHAQVTHVLVACVQHHEPDGLHLSLKQRMPKRLDFWTVWRLAKTLLTSSFKRVEVLKMAHANHDRSTVMPFDDGLGSFNVWPEVYRRRREQRPIPVDGENPRRRAARPKQASRGVKVLSPASVLRMRPPAPALVLALSSGAPWIPTKTMSSPSMRARIDICHRLHRHRCRRAIHVSPCL